VVCVHSFATLSSLGLLLACSSPSVDAPPTREKAAPIGVTSRATLGRAAAATPPDRLANYDARSAEAARGSPALRTKAFEWARPASSRAAAASAVVAPPRDAVEAARAFLGLSTGGVPALTAPRPRGGALDETVVTGVHDIGHGPVIVQLKRQVAGLDVYGQTTAVLLTRDLVPVARSGAPVGADHATPALRGVALDARTAMAAALADLTGEAYGAADLATVEAKGGYDRAALAPGSARAGRLVAPARARKVLFPLAGDLVPAYQIEVALRQARIPLRAFAYVISADDGAVLVRRNEVQNDSGFSYLVWADPATSLPYDGPQGLAGTPYPDPTPDGYHPSPLAQNTVALSSFSGNVRWLDPAATTANGNNAHAYVDLEPDGFDPGDIEATVTAAGEFSTAYDFAGEPYTDPNTQAAIVQLFYDVNFFHDWYYDSGFDEAFGNAQLSNFGRGGEEGDPLMAEAQDFEGVDNANMYTPADGFSPVMQMFLWNGNGQRHLEVTAPSGIARKYEGQIASFGPDSFPSEPALAVAAAVPADACSAITNGAVLTGKIALVDRGGGDTCFFSDKVKRAQDAGAKGVIVRNVDASQGFGGMAAADGYDGSVIIPSLLVSLETGGTLGNNLGGSGVTARLYREKVPMRDGTIDSLIVAHEWGHYISNRLVGNGGGLQDVQAGGLGEGWGDTHAMLLAVRERAGYDGTYGLAGWVAGGEAWDGNGSDGYYFGVRRVPYSTDMTKDPLTFRHIGDGQRLVPVSSLIPVAFGADGANNSEVHNAGEVWATMLWECYAALLRDTLGTAPRLTFQETQDRWKDYLVAAYKLTPTNPTFLEARDALLAVARTGDLRDYQLFWQSFAKRGAGVNAIGPGKWTSFDNTPVVESFEADPHLSVVSVAFQSTAGTCSDGDAYLDAGESGDFTVQLRNDGVSAVPATHAVATGTGLSFPGTPVDVPASAVGDLVTMMVPVSMTEVPSGSTASFVLTFAATASAVEFTTTVPVAVNLDVVASSSTSDTFREPQLVWTADGSFDGQPGWKLSADGAWAEGTNGTSDLRLVSPDLVVGSQPLRISFSHRYLFDTDSVPTYYDGGVVELSPDGGATWTDVGASAYDGTLFDGGIDDPNPLAGRDAFTFVNASYPDFDTVNLTLGTAYAGEHVKLRFRMGSDISVGWGGWTVRRVELSGITNQSFPLVRADAGTCAGSGGGGGGGGGGCATGGGSAGLAALLAMAALAFRLRRRRRGA
jgi:hypothetical protein